jgi:hypothetical protein
MRGNEINVQRILSSLSAYGKARSRPDGGCSTPPRVQESAAVHSPALEGWRSQQLPEGQRPLVFQPPVHVPKLLQNTPGEEPMPYRHPNADNSGELKLLALAPPCPTEGCARIARPVPSRWPTYAVINQDPSFWRMPTSVSADETQRDPRQSNSHHSERRLAKWYVRFADHRSCSDENRTVSESKATCQGGSPAYRYVVRHRSRLRS